MLEERFKSLSSPRKTGLPERPVSNGRQSLGGLEKISRSSSSRFSSRNLPKNGSMMSTSSKIHDCSKLVDDHDDHDDDGFEENGKDKSNHKHKDFVSGMLYDMLQKEVLNLNKACHLKDQNLKDKDNTIEVCIFILLHTIYNLFIILIIYFKFLKIYRYWQGMLRH